MKKTMKLNKTEKPEKEEDEINNLTKDILGTPSSRDRELHIYHYFYRMKVQNRGKIFFKYIKNRATWGVFSQLYC